MFLGGYYLGILKWFDHNIEKFLSGILLIAFSSLMIINVLLLFLFGSAISWASEAVLTLFVFFVWIAISYAFKERKHIKVTALVGLLPVRTQRILEIVINLGIILFFFILIHTSFEYMMHPSVQKKTSLLLKYPMWIYYLSAPVGASLSIIRLIQITIIDYKILKTKKV